MMFKVRKDIDATQIDDTLLSDVSELVDALTVDGMFVVSYGVRTMDEQAALHAKFLAGGPRAVAPEKSAHVGANFPDGKARAVDLTLVKHGADAWDYLDPAWRAFVSAVNAHPRLHSLDHLGDTDHVEKVGWAHERNGAT